MEPYRILCFSGGGARGVISAELLLSIILSRPDVVERADLLPGTSVGGIIALGLAFGVHPGDIRDLLLGAIEDVFKPRGWFDTLAGGADELVRADYSSEPLERHLQAVFKLATMGHLQKDVAITAYDMTRRRAKIFDRQDDAVVPIVAAAMATATAPVYFPTWKMTLKGQEVDTVDGGVYAPNPALVGVFRALKEGVPLEAIRVLSIGTGATPVEPITGGDLGLAKWATRLIEIWQHGLDEVTNMGCGALLGDRYHQVQPQLDEVIGMDAGHRGADFVRIAREFDLQPTLDWMSRWW